MGEAKNIYFTCLNCGPCWAISYVRIANYGSLLNRRNNGDDQSVSSCDSNQTLTGNLSSRLPPQPSAGTFQEKLSSQTRTKARSPTSGRLRGEIPDRRRNGLSAADSRSAGSNASS